MPLKCPVGTYGDSAGVTSVSGCKPCKEGFYCDVKAKLDDQFTMNICQDGYLCNAGSYAFQPSISQNG